MTRRLILTTARQRGRLTAAQRSAYEQHGGRLLACPDTLLDWPTVFNSTGNVVVEIGFGDGDCLRSLAMAHPDWCFLGLELYKPGVGAALVKCAHANLTNVRIIHEDVRIVWPMIPNASVARIHVLFSDPWPKKRTHKRRLLQYDQLCGWLEKLMPGGILYLATDDASYQTFIEAQVAALSDVAFLDPAQSIFMPNTPKRPETKYEQRGRRLGHAVRDWCIKKL